MRQKPSLSEAREATRALMATVPQTVRQLRSEDVESRNAAIESGIQIQEAMIEFVRGCRTLLPDPDLKRLLALRLFHLGPPPMRDQIRYFEDYFEHLHVFLVAVERTLHHLNEES